MSKATLRETIRATAAAQAGVKMPPPAPAAPTTQTLPAKTTRLIPVDLIERDENQPRRHFDEDELLRLAESLDSLGQLQEVTVDPIEGTDRFRLVAGERRWRRQAEARVIAPLSRPESNARQNNPEPHATQRKR